MRLLGIDYGLKRIGIAFGDSETGLAFPHEILLHDRRRFARIKTLCAKEHVAAIVIGLPIGMEGQETLQTRKTRAFGEKLAQSLKIPVHFWDERLTTKMLLKDIREGTIRKDLVDASSAAVILQGYLDRKRVKR